jgi:glycosyltransferase involved in cell wall biosynthesis
MTKKRVLILEPYYGGSHKLFLQGLQDTIDAEYTLLTLPARKWKSRMQLSALWFAREINKLPGDRPYFDTVLCSTFVDVAVLRALLQSVTGWNSRARILTYFHENQFAYPGQFTDPGIQQFASINFNTAMASDSCAFNSHYNLNSFLTGIRHRLKKISDMKMHYCEEEIRNRSVVLYPGMDYGSIDKCIRATEEPNRTIPVVVWNHRWEHDKGPELFFEALRMLKGQGVLFRLIVLGESFVRQPSCFAEAKLEFAQEIIHFGYAESRDQYARLLRRGDVVISTARHEFFGIAILEAVRAGCYPLLPDDLSYPELYDAKFLYKAGELSHLVKHLTRILQSTDIRNKEDMHVTNHGFEWQQCKADYEQWLFGAKKEEL